MKLKFMMEIQSLIEFYDQRGRAFFATLQFTFSWGILYDLLLFEQKLSRPRKSKLKTFRQYLLINRPLDYRLTVKHFKLSGMDTLY